MRGRKCHGARKAKYRVFRLRSLKRARRANKIHARNKWQFHHGPYEVNANWPWLFEGGVGKMKQRACKQDVPNHTEGVYPIGFGAFFVVASGGSRREVAIFRVPSRLVPPPHNTHDQDVGSVWRFKPLLHRGHKIGRQTGFGRKCWGAYRWWRATGGHAGGMWPSWDPQHRTPVDPST